MSVARAAVRRQATTTTRDNHEQCDCKSRRHRTKRQPAPLGRIHGHPRRRRRLRHSRRHPRQLGRRVRLHRRATRRHRRRRFHRLLLRHHHRRRHRGQDRLRQAGRRGASCSTCSPPSSPSPRPRDRPRTTPTISFTGARSSSRSPTARSKPWPIRSSPRSSPQPHALPEHPARELARRPGARRSRRLDSRRAMQLQLEDATRPLPRPDRPLRHHVLRSALPEIRSLRKRASASARCSRTWACSGALVACYLVGSSSRINWAHARCLHGDGFSALRSGLSLLVGRTCARSLVVAS